jgi:ABC-type lipoprotein release transport system permease subunit
VVHALVPTGVGVAAGLLAAVSVSRVMESFVYGIEPNDPPTYALAGGILLCSAAIAAWIPARRAASIDPARVLTEAG